MRSDRSSVEAPLPPSAGVRDQVTPPLADQRRSRPADRPRSAAAERSAARTGAARATRDGRPPAASRPFLGQAAPRTDAPRPSTAVPTAVGGRLSPAPAGIDDALRDRVLLVAAAAALCAVLALALLSGLAAGIAVAIAFVPSLAGGWVALTLVPWADGDPSPSRARAGGALLVAHAIALVPVAAAILLAG